MAGLFSDYIPDKLLPEHESDREIPIERTARSKRVSPQESEFDEELMSPDAICPVMKMTQAAYAAVMSDLASEPFRRELGGLLLGPDDAQDLVTRYVKDDTGLSTYATFTIGHERLNQVLRRVRPAKQTCVGIVHSHPDGICRPSGGDLAFLSRIFASPVNGNGSHSFLFPIVLRNDPCRAIYSGACYLL